MDHTLYDHSSVPKTAEQLFSLSPLTKRDAAANSVLGLLTLTTPRTDCPTLLNSPALLLKAAKPPMTTEERAQRDAQPVPQSGNMVGALQILMKTERELSGGTPEEIAAIHSRFAAIQTRGQARAYAESVMQKVGNAKEQRKLAARRKPGQPNSSATKIMIIRHAEKPPDSPPPHGVNSHGDHDKESLTVRGWQRAGALAVLFAPSNGPFQNPDIATPQFVYASGVGPGSPSERPQETVTPLIDKLGGRVSVNFHFDKGQEPSVAASALACKGIVLICWEHESIPAIVSHIPISQNNKTPVPGVWPVDRHDVARYDVVWIFELDSGAGGYLFNQVAQLLLVKDTPI